MMAAVVDYDLGDELRGRRYYLAEAWRDCRNFWYLNGPADGTDGAEDVGCDGDIHGTANFMLVRMFLYDRLPIYLRTNKNTVVDKL